jgi:hypothetical protein
MKMLDIICAAVVVWYGPETQAIPPLVHGVVIGDKIAGNKELLHVRFKNLHGKVQELYFEANTCKFVTKGDK